MSLFHVIGRWLPGQVSCRWVDGSFHPDAPMQQLIDQAWRQATSRPGVLLFDGPMCRLESFSASAHQLELNLSHTSYKAFLGTNLRHADMADRLGAAALANPVGISCALVSADGLLLMGRRNDRVAHHPGRIHPFAGTLEPGPELDIFDEACRELAEELSLDKVDLTGLVCLGIAQDRAIRQPELICLAHCTRTRQQIERQLDVGEHGGVWHLSPDPLAVQAALGDTTRRSTGSGSGSEVDVARALTPIAVATILLWGREQFGQSWFEATRPLVG